MPARTSPKTVRRAVAAVLAAATLAGCGTYPGSAAVVGETKVSQNRIDDAAVALCSANITGAEAQGQPAPQLPLRGARQAALQLILESELAKQFGDERGIEVDPSQVSAFVDQNQQAIELLPQDERQDFRDLLAGFRTAQLIFIAAGEKSLAEQGGAAAGEQAAETEGRRLFTEWAKKVDVEVDPRFGVYEDGALKARSGSLSIPVSKSAREGAADSPADSWTAGLPASQRCASPS